MQGPYNKYMIFHQPQRKIENMIPHHRSNSEPIERVTGYKILGLSVGGCLSWKAHVQLVSNKMSQNIGIVHRLKHYLPLSVLCNIYDTLNLSHFQYSIDLGRQIRWSNFFASHCM